MAENLNQYVVARSALCDEATPNHIWQRDCFARANGPENHWVRSPARSDLSGKKTIVLGALDEYQYSVIIIFNEI